MTPTARGGATVELLLHAKLAGHPLELAAVIGDGAWDFAGTLQLGAGDGAPDLGKLLSDLLKQAGVGLPGDVIPSAKVERLDARYASEAFALSGTVGIVPGPGEPEAGRKVDVLFAALPQGCVVALGFKSEIPLQIDILRGVVGEISLSQLHLLYASAAVDEVPAAVAKLLPRAPGNGQSRSLARGISVGARLGTGTDGHDLSLAQPATEAGSPPAPAKPGDAPTTTADSAKTDGAGTFRKWFSVDKTFGPLALQRVGGEWNGKEGRLGVLLDAAVDLFGLRVGLAGLKLSLPVKDPKPEKLVVDLDGLDLGFKSGPVEISGGLLRIKGKDASVEYTGTAVIKTEAFSVSGFGSYTMVGNEPSLFIYALLDRDLGGPPCFHVTGLAAGFGYNRALKIPEIDRVHEFPLIQAAMHPESFRDLGTMRKRMAECIPVVLGQYWLAAGVRFTSFQMIESFALIALTFGTETVITGLGLSRLTVPPPLPSASSTPATTTAIETIASVEIALKIVFRPESGVLTAEARLTPNSYVFSKECKLTGGFAFYAWFKDLKRPGKRDIAAGDFVATLGGYHPSFVPPDHYPVVPRLALNWKVSESLCISGEVYFAITPTCLMAGGRLGALFAAGGLRVWFDAYADFLISWKPVRYQVDVGVRMGISYHFSLLGISSTIGVEMSAAVHLWGPPFAGKAEVNWTVISFTVYFGETEAKPAAAIGWQEFSSSFLPPSQDATKKGADPLTVAVTRGVVSEVKPSDGAKGYVIVNPHQAAIVVKSAMPSTKTTVKGGPLLPAGAAFGIRPMSVDAGQFSSETEIEVERAGDAVGFAVEPIVQNVPAALWAPKPFELKADRTPDLVGNVVTGVQLTPRRSEPVAPYTISVLDRPPDRSQRDLRWSYRYARAGHVYEPEHVVERIWAGPAPARGSADSVFRRVLHGVTALGLVEASVGGALDRDLESAYRSMRFQHPPIECEIGALPPLA